MIAYAREVKLVKQLASATPTFRLDDAKPEAQMRQALKLMGDRSGCLFAPTPSHEGAETSPSELELPLSADGRRVLTKAVELIGKRKKKLREEWRTTQPTPAAG